MMSARGRDVVLGIRYNVGLLMMVAVGGCRRGRVAATWPHSRINWRWVARARRWSKRLCIDAVNRRKGHVWLSHTGKRKRWRYRPPVVPLA